MKQKITALIMSVALTMLAVMPLGPAQQLVAQVTPAQSNTTRYVAQDQPPPPPTRAYRSESAQRSYERETHVRRHHRITKTEVALLAGVAVTPMGIGAIAAGGHGLAIGAIVGGWSAVGAHFIWRHFHNH